QSFTRKLEPRRREMLDLRVSGRAGEPMAVACGEQSVASAIPLQSARTAPLTTEKLREHLGRFGEHAFAVGDLELALAGVLILPIGEMNRLRRELAYRLEVARKHTRPELDLTWRELFADLQPHERVDAPEGSGLSVLCRSMEQIEAALGC